MLKDSTIVSNTKRSNTEGSEKDDDSLEEDDHSSVNSDNTQLYAPLSDISDDEVSLRQSNDNSEVGQNQPVEEKPSYYSFGDFEPQKSELEEVKLDLQAPSKVSSRYGSMKDVSGLFWLAASNQQDI